MRDPKARSLMRVIAPFGAYRAGDMIGVTAEEYALFVGPSHGEWVEAPAKKPEAESDEKSEAPARTREEAPKRTRG